MKDGLENIDEVFKQAFDGFEGNVDPSVWTNVQNAIGGGAGGVDVTPKIDPSTVTAVATKSIITKIAVGVALVGTIGTAGYYIVTSGEKLDEATENNQLVENNAEKIVENQLIEKAQPIESDNSKEEKESAEYNILVKDDMNTASSEQKNEETVNRAESNISNEERAESTTSNVSSSEATVKTIKENTSTKQSTPQAEKPAELSANINVNVGKGKAPLTVQFDAIGNGVQYFWNFKDGSDILNGESQTHTFFKEGTYSVELTAQDKNGNTKIVNARIIVEKNYDSSLEPLPNVMSPNGDGINDFYKIRGKNISKLEAVIMDKTGKQIYTIKSVDDYWDGKDQAGNYVMQGQYYISGIAIGDDGKKHLIKQAINIRN